MTGGHRLNRWESGTSGSAEGWRGKSSSIGSIQLISAGAQLVETLPRQEYGEGHLPGALSLPLKQLTRERAAELDRGRPVVVYCWDSL